MLSSRLIFIPFKVLHKYYSLKLHFVNNYASSTRISGAKIQIIPETHKGIPRIITIDAIGYYFTIIFFVVPSLIRMIFRPFELMLCLFPLRS